MPIGQGIEKNLSARTNDVDEFALRRALHPDAARSLVIDRDPQGELIVRLVEAPHAVATANESALRVDETNHDIVAGHAGERGGVTAQH